MDAAISTALSAAARDSDGTSAVGRDDDALLECGLPRRFPVCSLTAGRAVLCRKPALSEILALPFMNLS
jgi:hypothetical protein